MAPIGSYWLLLATIGSFFLIKIYFKRIVHLTCWLLLAPNGSYRLLLAPIGYYWLISTYGSCNLAAKLKPVQPAKIYFLIKVAASNPQYLSNVSWLGAVV